MTPDGFRRLTLEHKDRVYSYAAWLGGDPEEAQDVTQEAFMRLWMHRDRVVPEAARTWLLRTAHRLCIDRARRRRPRTAGADLDPPALAAGLEPGPEPACEEAETRRNLARALGLLPLRDRALLLLRETQGLTHAQIGSALDMPVGSVKAALHRARRRLQAELTLTNETTP